MPVVSAPATRETSGISTSAPGFALGNFPFPTPPRLNQYFNDFNTYAAGDWTVTAVGGGTSALATTVNNGGKLLLTSGATTSDIQGNQLTTTSFAFTSGSQVWYSINISLGSITAVNFMAGMSNTFAALAPTDGVYFSKPTAAATLNGVIRAGSTSTTIALGTMVAATAYTLSFYYNGVDRLSFFTTIGLAANGFVAPGNGSGYYSGGSQIAGTASSETGATNSLVNLPAGTVLLTPGFAIQTTATGAKTATVDYMLAAEEIVARF